MARVDSGREKETMCFRQSTVATASSLNPLATGFIPRQMTVDTDTALEATKSMQDKNHGTADNPTIVSPRTKHRQPDLSTE